MSDDWQAVIISTPGHWRHGYVIGSLDSDHCPTCSTVFTIVADYLTGILREVLG